jgi:hypothetical protein
VILNPVAIATQGVYANSSLIALSSGGYIDLGNQVEDDNENYYQQCKELCSDMVIALPNNPFED